MAKDSARTPTEGIALVISPKDDSSRPKWEPEVHAEINKRMTMNMLIQGAAWQACLTAHHLVSEELDDLHPRCNAGLTNTEFYDRFSVATLIGQWNSEIAFFTGLSSTFWRQVGSGKTDFCQHPLLVKHGKRLARESKKKTLKRCYEKGVWGQPIALTLQATSLLLRCDEFEKKNRITLEQLGVKATSEIWGLDPDEYQAGLTDNPTFGHIRHPRTKMGERLKNLMVGWGGVQTDINGELYVVGRSKYWSLLLHELTKGTVELIALHGLNELDDETYQIVMLEADNIEFEVWMMQSGLELYRRLLDVIPKDGSVAEAIMSVALMPATIHEAFSMAVIDQPDRAKAMLREFWAG